MMISNNKYVLITLLISTSLFVSSCINETFFGESGLNKILYFSLEGQTGNSIIKQDSSLIYVTVSQSSDITSLKPDSIKISTFASIEPSAEAYRNFTDPQLYYVTAENGDRRIYRIIVNQEGAEPQLENSSLDDWYTPAGKNYKEPGLNENTIWATANAGVTVLNPDNFNTTPLLISGSDFAAQLVTKDLGILATGQRMGSATLFTGKFILNIPDPPSSAQFGISFSAKPHGFSVDIKYEAGFPYKNKLGTVIENMIDSADVYVLLENREDPNAVKRIATGWYRSGDLSDFQTIDVEFIYGTLPVGTPDYQRPANGLYGTIDDQVTHISVVFASSANGISYEGGVNSTLVVNNLELHY